MPTLSRPTFSWTHRMCRKLAILDCRARDWPVNRSRYLGHSAHDHTYRTNFWHCVCSAQKLTYSVSVLFSSNWSPAYLPTTRDATNERLFSTTMWSLALTRSIGTELNLPVLLIRHSCGTMNLSNCSNIYTNWDWNAWQVMRISDRKWQRFLNISRSWMATKIDLIENCH